MHIKIHKSYRPVVALCDSNILGKKFESGVYQLHITENFYKGEEMSKEEVIKTLIKWAIEDSTFNIAGQESIKTAIEAGIIQEKNIAKIQDIPYALSF
ncbi:MAG: DUF424 family protein [Nanoarchaeota archaeon]|nr:DUF424 family protein [Nanoarchaeota archaeon]